MAFISFFYILAHCKHNNAAAKTTVRLFCSIYIVVVSTVYTSLHPAYTYRYLRGLWQQ